MRDILLLVFILALAGLTLRKPFYGVLMWCWVSYMLPHKLTWGFMNTFPVAQFAAITFFVSLLLYKESKKIHINAPIVWWILFNISMLISMAASYGHYDSAYTYPMAAKVQLFTILIYMMLNSRERIEKTLWVICLSIGYYGVKGGIFTLLTGGGYRVWGPGGGFFSGNNELGLTLLMIIPILYYFYRINVVKWQKSAIAAAMALCLVAVFGTHSRGALVAIIAVGGFFWLKSDKKLVAAILIIMMLPVGYMMMPESWSTRMSTIVQSDEESYDSSIQGRFNAWRVGYRVALNNVVGDGFNSFNRINFILYAPNPDDFHDAHSIYFKVLGNQGFVGLFLFLSMWISAWRLANRVQKLVKDRQDLMWANLLCRMLQVSFVAYASGGTFLGLSYFDLPYHMLITVCAVYVIVCRELKQSESEQIAAKPALQ